MRNRADQTRLGHFDKNFHLTQLPSTKTQSRSQYPCAVPLQTVSVKAPNQSFMEHHDAETRAVHVLAWHKWRTLHHRTQTGQNHSVTASPTAKTPLWRWYQLRVQWGVFQTKRRPVQLKQTFVRRGKKDKDSHIKKPVPTYWVVSHRGFYMIYCTVITTKFLYWLLISVIMMKELVRNKMS